MIAISTLYYGSSRTSRRICDLNMCNHRQILGNFDRETFQQKPTSQRSWNHFVWTHCGFCCNLADCGVSVVALLYICSSQQLIIAIIMARCIIYTYLSRQKHVEESFVCIQKMEGWRDTSLLPCLCEPVVLRFAIYHTLR
jgi:hypothetical protein